MAKKTTTSKTENKRAIEIPTVKVPAAETYKVRVICSDCGAQTLETISVPQLPKKGDEISFACKKLISGDNVCCGHLTVISVFSKE